MSAVIDMFPEVRLEDPNRRYTTREFMAWIMERAGVTAWDLDAAADLESHHAPRWFSLLPYPGSAGVDGLAQSWLPRCPCRGDYCTDAACDWPDSVWCIFVNPPFDDLEAWVAKAWATVKEAKSLGIEVRIAFVLPGNRHEQPFWQAHVEPFRDRGSVFFGYRLDCHFPPGRQAYAKPGSNGVPVGSADFPSCLLVWRRA
jgi:hypothetical protein